MNEQTAIIEMVVRSILKANHQSVQRLLPMSKQTLWISNY